MNYWLSKHEAYCLTPFTHTMCEGTIAGKGIERGVWEWAYGKVKSVWVIKNVRE